VSKRNGTSSRAGLLAMAIVMPVLFTGCPKNDPPPRPRAAISTSRRPVTQDKSPVAGFNGERAMDHVRKQLDFGPRPPGSPELEKTRAYIANELRSSGWTVSLDEFTAITPQGEKKMVNIIGEIPGETKTTILLASHYDTKYYKDMRFVGANDPATSVATLLEMGRVLGSMKEKSKVTYRLVFFDGEEAFCEGWSDCKNKDGPDNTYGSRRYASLLKERNQIVNTAALILLDMTGYKNLQLGRDTSSTPWLLDIIWQTGRELGHDKIFLDREEGVGGDDHEPFMRHGIDAVDIIQLTSYPHWHKADDTIDKVSAQSMKIVGETVLASLPKIVKEVTKEKKE
jgi:Zn-dependent M28 family amino/carboxypeptidase